jgi:PAS domain S-box-containing protein
MSDPIKDFTDLASGERLREELRSAGFIKAADGILIIDTKGKIICVNEQVTTFFWYTEEELLGASVDMLVPEGARAAHSANRDSYSDNPIVKSMGVGRELMGRRKDGKEFRVEISLNPLPHRNEMFFMASIRRPS